MAEKLYKLINSKGEEYLSEVKGNFGGHRKQKIYGRLDCPTALRAIKRPTGSVYLSNRVFFSDEKTARAAGYRPCSVCMREHYELWKADKLDDFLNQE